MGTKLLLSNSKGYTAPMLRNWIVSADRHRDNYATGLILLNNDPEIIELCKKHNVYIFPFFDDPIPVQQYYYYRCLLISRVLNTINCDYVLLTDIRDVAFQGDPFPGFIAKLGNKKAVLTSENITHGNEPWNLKVMLELFGQETTQRLKEQDVINSGVMFGRPAFLSELNRLMYDVMHSLPGEPIRDQAALNYLYYTYQLIRRECVVATGDDAIVTHVGVAGPSVAWEVWNFKNNLKCGHALFDEATSRVVNHRGEPYPIVHQYDRVAPWAEAISRIHAG
jgi:hypothetical protein